MPTITTRGAASAQGFGSFLRTSGSQADPRVLAIYHLDGIDGQTTFEDATGRSVGVVYRPVGAQLSTVNPKFGTASLRTIANSSLAITMSSAIQTNEFTVEFWVRLDTLTGVQILYDQRGFTSANLNDISPVIYWTGTTFGYYTAGANRITGGTATANTWIALAVSRKAGVTRMYVNGVSVGQFNDSYSYINNIACAGGNRISDDSSLIGQVDEVRVSLIGWYDQPTYTVASSPFLP